MLFLVVLITVIMMHISTSRLILKHSSDTTLIRGGLPLRLHAPA